MSAVFLYSVNLSFSGQERTAIKKKTNIWLSLGFMRTRKVMQFERTGHYQSKKRSLLFNFSVQECV